MPLSTRCPRCGRIFPAYAQELKARRGRVSCPQCSARFDGVAALLDEPMPAFEPTPEQLWVPARTAGTLAAPLSARPSQVANRLGVGGSKAPRLSASAPPPAALAQRRRWPAVRWGRLGWLLGSLALVLTLAGQWLWWQRDNLLQSPRGRAVLEALCWPLGCDLPLPRVAGSLALLTPSLEPDKANGGALTLRLTIENRGQLPQPAPVLELELFDREGDLAANRRFGPAEYAPGVAARLEPGEARPVQLALAPPRVETSGFKVRLR